MNQQIINCCFCLDLATKITKVIVTGWSEPFIYVYMYYRPYRVFQSFLQIFFIAVMLSVSRMIYRYTVSYAYVHSYRGAGAGRLVFSNSRDFAYQALPLFFQRATLKSWVWPGDEATIIICYSYTMVTRDLSRKTTRSPRAQPEGEVWFSVINPWLPWYKCYISSA